LIIFPSFETSYFILSTSCSGVLPTDSTPPLQEAFLDVRLVERPAKYGRGILDQPGQAT